MAKDDQAEKKAQDKAGDKAADGAAAPKRKKKLIVIVAAVVLLLGGGAGGYFAFKPSAAKAEPAPVAGVVVPLDAITVNLADGHYLKLRLSLQATATAVQVPDGSKALDVAIELYSNRAMAELMSNAERERSKSELKDRIVTAYTVDKNKEIMDVYFTSFVIQ